MDQEKVCVICYHPVSIHSTIWCVVNGCPCSLSRDEATLIYDKWESYAEVLTLTAERDALKELALKAGRCLITVAGYSSLGGVSEKAGEIFNEINRTLLEMESK